ncbi:MAG TPA: tetratricopeptide repeat protein [Pyrinomonadaceae bacterium]
MRLPRATAGFLAARNAPRRVNIEVKTVGAITSQQSMINVSQRRFGLGVALVLFCLSATVASVRAQTNPLDQDDPVKLFERGQDAHAKNDYKKAIEFYDAAIKLKPEFPEAEFQRALALLFSNQKEEALRGFNRAAELRPDWGFAYARFGSLLSSYYNDDKNGEPILRRAIEIDPQNVEALVALADLRARAGDINEALNLSKAATSSKDATASTWRKRSFIEIRAGDRIAALASVDKALSIEPSDLGARYDRAKLRLDVGDKAGALEDLAALDRAGHGNNVPGAFELAQLYERAGRNDEALRVLDALPEKERQTPEIMALRAELAGSDGSTAEERAAFELMLEREPKNAALLARLGAAYRRIDPLKSQDYYYRALQIEPENSKFAIGYAAALIQGRHFAEAVTILRRVIARTPDEYTAHTNLALALYESKDFRAAIPEYEWIAAARPELATTYFYLAIAHDNLQEYQEALDAYERFLARANPATNQLEIDKVNLRLPVLRAQIKRGQGKRKAS